MQDERRDLTAVNRDSNTHNYGSLNLSELDVVLAMRDWFMVWNYLSDYAVEPLLKVAGKHE